MESGLVIDFSKQLIPFLPEVVRKAIESRKVNQIIEPGSYEVKHLQVMYCNRNGNENKALKTLAGKLEKVYSKYGIIGNLSICIYLELCGPEAIVAPFDKKWNYEVNPIGPGTLGYGKTEEEIKNLTNRKLLISYPAIPWDSLFAVEGEIPNELVESKEA